MRARTRRRARTQRVFGLNCTTNKYVDEGTRTVVEADYTLLMSARKVVRQPLALYDDDSAARSRRRRRRSVVNTSFEYFTMRSEKTFPASSRFVEVNVAVDAGDDNKAASTTTRVYANR